VTMMFQVQKSIARNARMTALMMVHNARSSHIGSSLSLIEIAVQLFLKSTKNPDDVVLISKGHAAAGIYAVLNHLGLVPDEWIASYCANGSKLGGHVTSTNLPFLELSTGSLGHALPYGVGRAIGKTRLGQAGHVYVVLSDGECDEGSNWEAALIAPQLRLKNLTVIIDRNRLQSLGGTEDTVPLEPLAKKWESFNWEVFEIDGHDFKDLAKTTDHIDQRKPRVYIAETVKGKGVSFMENSVLWHYRPPNIDEMNVAIEELK
jgi:transketolase